ncbi:hypothetical protein ACWDSL_40950 [Streptomyces sp. NPDC000941]
MSWHIHPRDAQLFADVEHVPNSDPSAQWGDHSATTKYDRMREHIQRLAADCP